MPLKSANDRFTSHRYRSENGSLTTFHQNIKKHGADNFRVSVLEVVRGKKQAHLRELELIKSLKNHINPKKVISKLRFLKNSFGNNQIQRLSIN